MTFMLQTMTAQSVRRSFSPHNFGFKLGGTSCKLHSGRSWFSDSLVVDRGSLVVSKLHFSKVLLKVNVKFAL